MALADTVGHPKFSSSWNLSHACSRAINLIAAATGCYTDWFMKQVIDMLRDRKAVVIYQSDHGESLGENGKYLHGEETEELHWPAAFIWYSDKYKQQIPGELLLAEIIQIHTRLIFNERVGFMHEIGICVHLVLIREPRGLKTCLCGQCEKRLLAVACSVGSK